MELEKKKEIEEKFRDRLMSVFLEACNESGFELSGVSMFVVEAEEAPGGHQVLSNLDFYWQDELDEEDGDEIDMQYLAGLNRNLPKS